MGDVPPVSTDAKIELGALATSTLSGATREDGTSTSIRIVDTVEVSDPSAPESGSLVISSSEIGSKDAKGDASDLRVSAGQVEFTTADGDPSNVKIGQLLIRTVRDLADIGDLLHADPDLPKTYLSSDSDDIVLSGKNFTGTHVITLGELRNYSGTSSGEGVLQRYLGHDADAPLGNSRSLTVSYERAVDGAPAGAKKGHFKWQTDAEDVSFHSPEFHLRFDSSGSGLVFGPGTYLDTASAEVTVPSMVSPSGVNIQALDGDVVLQGRQVRLMGEDLWLLPGVQITTNEIRTPLSDRELVLDCSELRVPSMVRVGLKDESAGSTGSSGRTSPDVLTIDGDLKVTGQIQGYPNTSFVEKYFTSVADFVALETELRMKVFERGKTTFANETSSENNSGDSPSDAVPLVALRSRVGVVEGEVEQVRRSLDANFFTAEGTTAEIRRVASGIVSTSLAPYATKDYADGTFITADTLGTTISNATSDFVSSSTVSTIVDSSVLRLLGADDKVDLSVSYMRREETIGLVDKRVAELQIAREIDKGELRRTKKDTSHALRRIDVLESGLQSNVERVEKLSIDLVAIDTDARSAEEAISVETWDHIKSMRSSLMVLQQRMEIADAGFKQKIEEIRQVLRETLRESKSDNTEEATAIIAEARKLKKEIALINSKVDTVQKKLTNAQKNVLRLDTTVIVQESLATTPTDGGGGGGDGGDGGDGGAGGVGGPATLGNGGGSGTSTGGSGQVQVDPGVFLAANTETLGVEMISAGRKHRADLYSELQKLQRRVESIKSMTYVHQTDISNLQHVTSQSDLNNVVRDNVRVEVAAVVMDNFYNKAQVDSVVDTLVKDINLVKTANDGQITEQEVRDIIDVAISGGTVSLTNYYKKSEVDTLLAAPKNESLTARGLHVDGATNVSFKQGFAYPLDSALREGYWELLGGSGFQMSRTFHDKDGLCKEVSYRWVIRDDTSLALVKFVDCAPQGVVMALDYAE